MKISRRKTKVIKIGSVYIGSRYPVAIQSMTKTKTADTGKTIEQISQLEKAGAEIVRLAVRDDSDARALRKIKGQTRLPLVADIHFNWRLALAAIESGVDKIRLNPGNIFKKTEVQKIARAAKLAGIPIRVGLNSGSLPGAQRYNRHSITTGTAQIMTKSALDYIRILEKSGFYDIVISLKASHILDTIEAYRMMSNSCDYPLHLGLTATGIPYKGAVKSAIAIGVLLLEGIGDTIRVSLMDKPQEEVKAAQSILEALHLRHFGPEIISCPTCGRCEVDLAKIAEELENELCALSPALCARPLRVAVMGCVVNGPGEAKEADIGVAFGKKEGLLFKKGRAVRKIAFDGCVDALLREISNPQQPVVTIK